MISYFAGCIRRSDDLISEDYDEIDRRNPPVFINNTRTEIVVAEGKDARLDCRVSNVGDRTVRSGACMRPHFHQTILTINIYHGSWVNISQFQ